MTITAIVLDASVAMKLVMVEERTPEARALLTERNEAGAAIFVPPHFHGEVANALHQQIRRNVLQPIEALIALDQVVGMRFDIHTFDAMAHRALEFASQHHLASVYDALYLVLALQLDAEFWTDDQRLLRALGGTFPNARWIGDYEAS